MSGFNIMFVCLGNICRSPAAHEVFENMVAKNRLQDYFFVESSGMDCYHSGDQADSRMRKTAARHGVDIDHYSRCFVKSDLDDYDLILGMDSRNVQSILAHCRTEDQRSKVKLFREFDPQGRGDVPDPWYGGIEGFELVWIMIERTCEALLDHLRVGLKL